jgi:hypothetical protein
LFSDDRPGISTGGFRNPPLQQTRLVVEAGALCAMADKMREDCPVFARIRDAGPLWLRWPPEIPDRKCTLLPVPARIPVTKPLSGVQKRHKKWQDGVSPCQ